RSRSTRRSGRRWPRCGVRTPDPIRPPPRRRSCGWWTYRIRPVRSSWVAGPTTWSRRWSGTGAGCARSGRISAALLRADRRVAERPDRGRAAGGSGAAPLPGFHQPRDPGQGAVEIGRVRPGAHQRGGEVDGAGGRELCAQQGAGEREVLPQQSREQATGGGRDAVVVEGQGRWFVERNPLRRPLVWFGHRPHDDGQGGPARIPVRFVEGHQLPDRPERG